MPCAYSACYEEHLSAGTPVPLDARPRDNLISAPCQRLIRRDRTLEVVGFHARDQANLFQRRKLLPGFGTIAKNQIKFTEVLVGAAVTPIEQYGFLIMLHRRAQLAQPAIGIADVILDIGVARVAQRCELERRDRPIPILGDER